MNRNIARVMLTLIIVAALGSSHLSAGEQQKNSDNTLRISPDQELTIYIVLRRGEERTEEKISLRRVNFE